VTFFTLLSGVCVMLNLAGSILSCQNAQLVNSLTHCQLVKPGDDGVCVCCERQQTGGCTNLGSSLKKYILIHDTRTKSWHTLSVCCLRPLGSILGSHRDLQLLQFVSSRMLKYFVPQRSSHVQHDCLNTHNSLVHQTVDFEEFVPPIPPPPYYPPEYTYTPVMDANRRTSRLHLIHCPYDICVPRVGCEAVYPGELPPPYEAVVAQTRTTQRGFVVSVDNGCNDLSTLTPNSKSSSQGGSDLPAAQPQAPKEDETNVVGTEHETRDVTFERTPSPSPTPVPLHFTRRSRFTDRGGQLSSGSLSPNVDVEEGLCCDVLDDICPSEPGVRNAGTGSAQSFRTSPPPEAPRERPRSLVDLQTYEDTKILVSRFLESSSGDLPPDVRHVVNDIKSVIASDERHMEEAILSASVLDQV
uniref:Family with sequence similarity 189 member A1 n=1 Tax=Petromyzon marinus TaxID=7757 RepID=S4RC27_PETMA